MTIWSRQTASRSRTEMEYELLDTGVFNDDRYLDVFVEYAKPAAEDVLIQITVCNRGPEAARLHVLPTLLFRNPWTWWPENAKPVMQQVTGKKGFSGVATSHNKLGDSLFVLRWLAELLFTENETNNERIFGKPNSSPYVKDAINNYVVHGTADAVNPGNVGTKCAAHYQLTVEPGQQKTIRLRLSDVAPADVGDPFKGFAKSLAARTIEADEFYRAVTPPSLNEDQARVMRQALAGMLWTKQYFGLEVDKWLEEHGIDPLSPAQQEVSQRRVVPHGERARHLHAGQMGVSVVRGVGPGISHHGLQRRRSRLRQGAARPDAAGIFSAPQRARFRPTNGTSAT